MSNQLGRIFVALAALLSGPALAQSMSATDKSSANDLAFGLDKLHWGMTARDAKYKYPNLDGLSPELWQQESWLSVDNYIHEVCFFVVRLTFDKNKLVGVDLTENGGASYKSCRNKIRATLLKQYGREPGGFSPARQSLGYSGHGEWLGPVTDITYNDLKNSLIEVNFAPTAGPP